MTGEKVATRMMLQMFILAVLAIIGYLLMAVKFLPDDSLVYAIPYQQVSGFSHVLLELAVLTGLIGAAIYTAVPNEVGVVTRTFRMWTLFLCVAFFAGAFDMLEGRHLLELPRVLDIALVVLLLDFMLVVARGDKDLTGQGRIVWLVGMSFIILAHLVSLIPTSSILVDRVLRVISVNMRFNIGYVLAGIAVIYWWPRLLNLYLIAGSLVVIGTLVSFAPLIATGQSRVMGATVILIIAWIALLYELTRRANALQPWINLGMLLFVISLGLIGGVITLPAFAQYTQGTLLSNLQLDLIMLAVLVILVGFARDVMMSKRSAFGFWSVAIGIAGGYMALLIVGGAQTLMERVLGIGYLDVQNVLVPLYALWISGLLVSGCGLMWLLLTQPVE